MLGQQKSLMTLAADWLGEVIRKATSLNSAVGNAMGQKGPAVGSLPCSVDVPEQI